MQMEVAFGQMARSTHGVNGALRETLSHKKLIQIRKVLIEFTSSSKAKN